MLSLFRVPRILPAGNSSITYRNFYHARVGVRDLLAQLSSLSSFLVYHSTVNFNNSQVYTYRQQTAPDGSWASGSHLKSAAYKQASHNLGGLYNDLHLCSRQDFMSYVSVSPGRCLLSSVGFVATTQTDTFCTPLCHHTQRNDTTDKHQPGATHVSFMSCSVWLSVFGRVEVTRLPYFFNRI